MYIRIYVYTYICVSCVCVCVCVCVCDRPHRPGAGQRARDGALVKHAAAAES